MLLQHLATNAGKVMLNAELLSKVWGPEYRDDLQYLRVWVSRLRSKLEPDPSKPATDQDASRASATCWTPTRGGGRSRRSSPDSGSSAAHRWNAAESEGRGAGRRPRRGPSTPHDPDPLDRREPGEGRLGALIDVAPLGAEAIMAAAMRRVGDHDPDVVPAEVPAERPLRVREVAKSPVASSAASAAWTYAAASIGCWSNLAREPPCGHRRGCRPVTGDPPSRPPCA